MSSDRPLTNPLASVIVRTYNEGRHLEDLLNSLRGQDLDGDLIEIIVVDSGSTDRTLDVAAQYETRLVTIRKDDFTFGRSLNMGCEAASGRYLVFISGHCIPQGKRWLRDLLKPLQGGDADYVYGCQLGDDRSRFSERQLFRKYYPPQSQIPQDGFFCNNANAALRRDTWAQFRFSEELTGLEDMELARRLYERGLKIAYVAEAAVYHLHDESWRQIKRRYERESIALQKIMPQVHLSAFDFLRYFSSAVLLDMGSAMRERKLMESLGQIVAFRFMQFWGSYCGHNEHRRLSHEMKEKYFYPR
mgnify:CR=1 FL=1